MVSVMRRLMLVSALDLVPAVAGAQDKPAKKPGTVYTFYGLLKLEQDPKVDDAEKLKEWQAFIKRSEEQVNYAKKAIVRWKNAAKLRLVDDARAADTDPKIIAQDKVAAWKKVVELYPRAPEARQAKKRLCRSPAPSTNAALHCCDKTWRPLVSAPASSPPCTASPTTVASSIAVSGGLMLAW